MRARGRTGKSGVVASRRSGRGGSNRARVTSNSEVMCEPESLPIKLSRRGVLEPIEAVSQVVCLTMGFKLTCSAFRDSC